MLEHVAQVMDRDEAISKIESEGYVFSHEAIHRGYFTRKGNLAKVITYQGRFSSGLKVILPNDNSTNYVRVLYFTKRVDWV